MSDFLFLYTQGDYVDILFGATDMSSLVSDENPSREQVQTRLLEPNKNYLAKILELVPLVQIFCYR
jgi:hypothetical protein